MHECQVLKLMFFTGVRTIQQRVCTGCVCVFFGSFVCLFVCPAEEFVDDVVVGWLVGWLSTFELLLLWDG